MKKITPIFEGDIVEGKLKLQNHVKKSMKRWIGTFRQGTHVDIIIRKHKEKRTTEQNSYYWAVVVPILADFFGHSNLDDMHEDLKLKFNPIQSKIDPSKVIGGTTTLLSTVEFFSADDSYVERICEWAAKYGEDTGEAGIYIPPPKKVE